MRPLLFALAIVVAALSISAASTPTHAGPSWPPLLSCPDTNGDGAVDLQNDILGVLRRFQTTYGGPPNPDTGASYALIYDTSGGNAIDLQNDILGTILRFQEQCPLIDQQVALTTQALMPYQDCQDAVDDGYVQNTQFVPAMGIHLQKTENVALPFWSGSVQDTNDQIRHPAGLICTDSNANPNIDVPGKLIGTWGAQPDPNVCPYYGIDPGTCSFTEPVGFGLTNTDEDNIDLDAVQRAWHSHTNMCLGGSGTTSWVIADIIHPSVTEANCLAGGLGACSPTCVWFDFYSWMSHTYAFIPNPAGRFMMWSEPNQVPGEGGGAGSGAAAGFDLSNAQLCFFDPEVAAAVAAGKS